jgi:hypothetical protein
MVVVTAAVAAALVAVLRFRSFVIFPSQQASVNFTSHEKKIINNIIFSKYGFQFFLSFLT